MGIVDVHLVLVLVSRAFLAFVVALRRRFGYAARKEGLRHE